MKRSKRPVLLQTAGGISLTVLFWTATGHFGSSCLQGIFLLLFIIGLAAVLLLFAAARIIDYLYVIAEESIELNRLMREKRSSEQRKNQV